jgi:hypothetical protein
MVTMATKPRQTYRDKLLQLAADYDRQAEEAAAPLRQKAEALRFAAQALNGHLMAKAEAHIDTKLEAAIALRGETHEETRPRAVQQTERQKWLTAAFADGQPHTTADLAQILGLTIPNDRKTLVRDLDAIGATCTSTTSKGRRGRRLLWQLKPTHGTGVLVPAKRRRVKPRMAARQRTAKLLDQIARASGPIPTSAFPRPQAISVLLNSGYIAKQAEGYVRTDKPFVV